MPYAPGNISGLGDIKLDLEISPKKTTTGGDIFAAATLSAKRDSLAIEGRTLVFFLKGEEVFRGTTDEHGKLSHNFIDLGFGNHKISVNILGHSGIEAKANYDFNETVKQEPEIKEPYIDIIGEDGKFKIVVRVFYKNEKPANNYPVFIVYSYFKKQPKEKQLFTNEYGNLKEEDSIFNFGYEERECDMEIYVGFFKKSFKNLFGPSKHPRIEIPEKGKRPLGLTPLRSFRIGRRYGAEALKKAKEE